MKGAANMRLVSSLATLVAIVAVMLAPFADRVAARYVPYARRGYDLVLEKRQDSDLDDEDLDQNASAPYQEQDDTNDSPSNASDGYDNENNEPDADSYEETPREQEGQADLERFFDDHLGASDRDGMDKENLPSNLIASLAERPKYVTAIPSTLIENPVLKARVKMLALPSVETRYIRLPDKKFIITNKITSQLLPAPTTSGTKVNDVGTSSFDNWAAAEQPMPVAENVNNNNQFGRPPSDGLVANDSAIVETEDDDFNPVYVTNDTRRPFRIEELGGFDPEEDFNDASQDIESNPRQTSGKRKSNAKAGVTDESDEIESESRPTKQEVRQSTEGQAPQVSFNYPTSETLFEDASETDEITFGQDDPYQTDLEAEMRNQNYGQVGRFNAESVVDHKNPNQVNDQDDQLEPRESTTTTRAREKGGKPRILVDNEDEGGWVNDGVDDMDIPSQAHQNMILDKAANRDALARRAAEEEAAANAEAAAESKDGDGGQSEDEGEGQRMPNTDYMKNDVPEGDDNGYAAK